MSDNCVLLACMEILGDEMAHSIYADMGLHWLCIAAMADPRSDGMPKQKAVIREWTRGQA